MTEAEYIAVTVALTNTFNTVFNFWLTITFAFLVAVYFISEKSYQKLRAVLIGLYAAASFIFIVRYASVVISAGKIVDRMNQAGYLGVEEAFAGQNNLTLGGTFILMIIGSVVSVAYSVSISREAKTDE